MMHLDRTLLLACLLAPGALAQQVTTTQLPQIEDGITVCFDAGTDPALVEAIYAANPQLKYNLTGRWPGSQGTPTTLTWSLIPDGVSLPGGVGEAVSPNNLFATMDSKFGNRSWITRIEESLGRWAELSGLSFQRITVGGNDWDDGASFGSNGSATRGDIRFGMHLIDGGSGILAYARFPTSSNPGDIVMDSGENWQSSSNGFRFMRNIVMHELGHSLGMAHVCSNGTRNLMEPFLDTVIDGPRHDELRAVQRHYGDPFEPNDGSGQATQLGNIVGPTLSLGVPFPQPIVGGNPGFSSLLSMDANGKSDWFEFQVDTLVRFRARLSPAGFVYDDSDQQANGSCPGTSNNIDSLSFHNLAMELRASNGTTILASASTSGLGKNEVISLPSLGPGTYFVRVFETNSPTQCQLYNLELTARGPSVMETIIPTGILTLMLP